MSSSLLSLLADLSREFGGPDYVLGGGGNTSAKDAERLWVKPSGTTLSGMTADSFVELDRSAIEAMLAATPIAEPAAREAFVKDRMAAAVRGGSGRPSVEAPLHHSFSAAFVAHTHPTAVNALTCARNGREACANLFPDALWCDYVDPGYKLCREMRERLKSRREETGNEPSLVFLKNHGLFVAAHTPEEIRSHMARVMDTLEGVCRTAGLLPEPPDRPGVPDPVLEQRLHDLFGEAASHLAAGPVFTPAAGPLTPDHMVYAKAYPMIGEPDPERSTEFIRRHGYPPKIIATARGVYGLGATAKSARLALDLARDAAHVVRLSEAFGGAEFMTDGARDFIENWEVESYRRSQSG